MAKKKIQDFAIICKNCKHYYVEVDEITPENSLHKCMHLKQRANDLVTGKINLFLCSLARSDENKQLCGMNAQYFEPEIKH